MNEFKHCERSVQNLDGVEMIKWVKKDWENTHNLVVGQEYLTYGFVEEDSTLYYSVRISEWGRMIKEKISESKGLSTYKERIEQEFANEYYVSVTHFAHINTPLAE